MYSTAEGAKQEIKMKDKKTILAWLPVGVMLTVIVRHPARRRMASNRMGRNRVILWFVMNGQSGTLN